MFNAVNDPDLAGDVGWTPLPWGYQDHIGLYPTPGGMAAFDAELSRYKSAKGSVQLPLGEPLPVDDSES